MTMKTYTQKDFYALPIVDGMRQCPPGDYSAVYDFNSTLDYGCTFGTNCTFNSSCKFDSECRFGTNCTFGVNCTFDSECRFGVNCTFSHDCTFDSNCRFGPDCEFGSDCTFTHDCWFGTDCKFSCDCKFSSDCMFGNGCTFEGYKTKNGYPFISIAGAGSKNRTTYFFNAVDEIIVRSGCFKGTLNEFREKVLKDCTPDSIKALQYLGMANIAAATFDPKAVQHDY
jgi:hypothetical protein